MSRLALLAALALAACDHVPTHQTHSDGSSSAPLLAHVDSGPKPGLPGGCEPCWPAGGKVYHFPR